MLSSTIILVLATLYDSCSAMTRLGDIITSEAVSNNTKLNCQYTVHNDMTLSEQEWPQDWQSFDTNNVKSLDDCTRFCDNRQSCVAAAYYPNAKGNDVDPKCIGVSEIGFATMKLRPSKTGDGVAQLVPNSCKKPVATPTPVGCTPRTLSDPNTGCKYMVTCNQEYTRTKHYAMSLARVKDTAACFKYLHNPYGLDSPGYGYTFYQGGYCMVNILNKHIRPLTPRANTENAQLIKGSC